MGKTHIPSLDLTRRNLPKLHDQLQESLLLHVIIREEWRYLDDDGIKNIKEIGISMEAKEGASVQVPVPIVGINSVCRGACWVVTVAGAT